MFVDRCHFFASSLPSLFQMRFLSALLTVFLLLTGLCMEAPFPAARDGTGMDRPIYEETTPRNLDGEGLKELDFYYSGSNRCGFTDPSSLIGCGVQLWMQWREKKELDTVCSILTQLLPFLPVTQCNQNTGEGGVDWMDRVEFSRSDSWSVLLVDHTIVLPLLKVLPIVRSDMMSLHIHYASNRVSRSVYACDHRAARLPVRLAFPERHGYHNRLLIPVSSELRNATLFLTFPRGSYYDVDELADLHRAGELPSFQSLPASVDCELLFDDSHPSFLLLSVPSNQSSPITVPFHLRTVLPSNPSDTQSNKTIRIPSITVFSSSKGYRRLPIFSEEITLAVPVGSAESPAFVLAFTLLTVAISTVYLLEELLRHSSPSCDYDCLLKTEHSIYHSA